MAKKQTNSQEVVNKPKKEVRRKKKETGRGGYFLKRCLAFIIDWYISSVLANLAISLASGLMNSEITVVTDLTVFSFGQALVMLLFVFITMLFYFVYIPMKVWPGQTCMMRVLQLKIVGLDGQDLTWKQMLLRFCVGCLILEGGFYFMTSITIDVFVTYLFASYKDVIDMVIGLPLQVLTIASCIFAIKDKKHSQLFHDRLVKSEVIDLYDGGNGAL